MTHLLRMLPLSLLLAACEPSGNDNFAPPAVLPVWSVAGQWNWEVEPGLDSIAVQQDGLHFVGEYRNNAGETIQVDGEMNGLSLYGRVRVLDAAGAEVFNRVMYATRDAMLLELDGYMLDDAGESVPFRVSIAAP